MITMRSNDRLRTRLSHWLRQPRKQNGSTDVTEIRAAIGTDVGLVRHENQDRAVIARFEFANPSRENFSVAIVCDGIGGIANGGQSAEMAVSEVIASLSLDIRASFSVRLVEAIRMANLFVHDTFRGNGGTTIVALLLSDSMVVAGTVGDSRIYTLTERRLSQVSIDDTIAEEVSRVSGIEAARALPESLSKSLAQYVGMGEGIEPRTYFFPIGIESSFVLTTDGAHYWTSNLFSQLLNSAPQPHMFVTRTLALSKWVGGQDNASMIFISTVPSKLKSESSSEPKLIAWDSFSRADFFDPFSIPTIETREIPPNSEKLVKRPSSHKAKRKLKPSSETQKNDSSKTETPLDPAATSQRVLHIEFSSDAEDANKPTSESATPVISEHISDSPKER